MKQMHNRKAIAMIELIFAIVIMGIVLMSAPMLISTAYKSGYVALQQESIAAASSEIGMILTHHWDERDTDENLSAPILITGGDDDLNESISLVDGNLTGVRGGTSIFSKRNFLTSVGGRLTATSPGTSNFTAEGDFDDIDDFTTLSSGLHDEESTTTSEGDIIDKNIELNTTVAYINDTPTAGTYAGDGNSITLPFSTTAVTTNTTNIKMVEVILTTTNTEIELQKKIILKAFSCNIGTYELEEETY